MKNLKRSFRKNKNLLKNINHSDMKIYLILFFHKLHISAILSIIAGIMIAIFFDNILLVVFFCFYSVFVLFMTNFGVYAYRVYRVAIYKIARKRTFEIKNALYCDYIVSKVITGKIENYKIFKKAENLRFEPKG